MRDASDYDRLAIQRLNELNRAARDARYRANIEFGILQARRVAALVLAVAAAAAGGPRIAAVIDGFAAADQRETSPAATDRDSHGR